MPTCLTFTIRNGERPLHLCYGSEDEASEALREFASSIDSVPDGETVFVRGGRPDGRARCVGFLKRNFISVEQDTFEDGDDSEESEPSERPERSDLPHPHGGGGHALEAATKIVKAAASEEA